jgi:hypothetical protein
MTEACVLTRSGGEFGPERVDDRYRLIRVIGEDTVGRLWLAEDELLWRRVALQEVAAGQPIGVALARLHLVKVYNAVLWAGLSWIVMEYPGETAVGVARPVGPCIPPPRTNGRGWRGRAAVPTSRNY